MINEEDLVVAGLAKLVGQELHTIDTHTIQSKNGPANKIDPKSFLSRRPVNRPSSPNIVKHQGMMFHAGVDESVVQSMYPEPQANYTATPAMPEEYIPSITDTTVTPSKSTQTINIASDVEKVFKSIDKSLKSIDKTQKLLLDTLNKLNLNSKQE